MFNYESGSQYTLTIRSTSKDDDKIFAETDFLVEVIDVNEPPTGLTISKNWVPENSESGYLIGIFHASDPDNLLTIQQTFTYTLLDSDGFFTIVGDQIQV